MVNSSAAEEYSYSEKEIVTEDGLKKIVKKQETSAGGTDIHQAITSIPHLECFFFFFPSLDLSPPACALLLVWDLDLNENRNDQLIYLKRIKRNVEFGEFYFFPFFEGLNC